MTSIKIVLTSYLTDTASRENGELLRNHILAHVEADTLVEIDFTQAVLTPSFADEAFGKLNANMSATDFNEKIKLQNLSTSQKALLCRVIANRFSQS